jgi:hypothetical protein
MKIPKKTRTRVLAALVLAHALAPQCGLGQDVAGSPPPEDADENGRRFLRERVSNYRIRPVGGGDLFTLSDELLLAWSNPVSGAAAGSIFVWTDAGRPVVICKCHISRRQTAWIETLVPLTAAPFEMTAGGLLAWRPLRPEAVQMPFPAAGDVAETARARQVQMRALARRFRAKGTWGEETPSDWEFRLMPNPLHEYTSEPAGIIDGAVFGFTQGTNPELVVLIEAARNETGALSWRFAANRLTRYAVQLRLGDELVLDLPRLERGPIDAPIYHTFNRYTEDPFAAVTEPVGGIQP